MSDFHDALHRAARPHGEAVGQGLGADAVVAASAEGISRGRRRRAAAMSGLAAVAAVVLIGTGVWAAPRLGVWEQEPADGEPMHAGPWRYEVGGDADAFPIDEPAVMLRGEDEVMCGDELSLAPGVTVHDPAAYGRELLLAAELTTLGAITDQEPPATPRPLDPDNPDGPWTGWDPDEPRWDGVVSGAVTSTRSATLLMDGDSVMGISQGSRSSSDVGGWMAVSAGGVIPREGACDESSLTWEELTSLDEGDPMDSLLVTQFWGRPDAGERLRAGESILLATIVVDPQELANTDALPAIGEHDRLDIEVESATLREPDGDEYQAFVVPRPEPGCSPLADLRDRGRPGVEDPEFTVALGEVGTLDGSLWGAEPVLVTDEGEEPWYVGRHAWVVGDQVSAGIKDPHLAWTSSSSRQSWALANGGNDPLRGDDCAYVQPIPDVDGAVFLVVDGTTWPGAAGAVEDLQTWIYLGDA